MPKGLTLTFAHEQSQGQDGYEYLIPVDVTRILTRLLSIPSLLTRTDDLSLSHHWQHFEHTSTMIIVIHLKGDLSVRVVTDILGQDASFIQITTSELCEEAACYQPVASSQYEAFTGVLLFESYGEDLHPLHTRCEFHCRSVDLCIANTLQVENTTPEEKLYWTKLLTWKLRSRYYGQRIRQYQDGDYESGYYDCCCGTPWVGPYSTRELARVAALDYEDE